MGRSQLMNKLKIYEHSASLTDHLEVLVCYFKSLKHQNDAVETIFSKMDEHIDSINRLCVDDQ